jgi:hypothetical protein
MEEFGEFLIKSLIKVARDGGALPRRPTNLHVHSYKPSISDHRFFLKGRKTLFLYYTQICKNNYDSGGYEELI